MGDLKIAFAMRSCSFLEACVEGRVRTQIFYTRDRRGNTNLDGAKDPENQRLYDRHGRGAHAEREVDTNEFSAIIVLASLSILLRPLLEPHRAANARSLGGNEDKSIKRHSCEAVLLGVFLVNAPFHLTLL